MKFITLFDWLLVPIYILLIRQIAITVRNRYYPLGHPWRPYFLSGMMMKIAGAIFISCIYQYYYGFGDTVEYYKQSLVINSSFGDSPSKWFNLLFRIPAFYDADYSEYISQMTWYTSANNYIVSTAGAMIGVFTFNKYLCISVVMSAIAYTGQWALFRTFARQYPHLIRYIGICMLYIPSVAIWGSGLFKDTICMFGLGWLTYSVFQLLVQRRFTPFNIAMMIFSAYIIGITKIYILAAFLPSLMLWVFLRYSYRIRVRFIRLLIIPLMLTGLVFISMYLSAQYSDLLGVYSADQFAERSAITRNYIYESGTDESSSYTLGEIDPTIQGMLTKFPLAVNVTLFRPYVWEARKPIVFLNALESLIFLFLALKLLLFVGPRRILKAIGSDPNIQFCLIFTMIFAFAIGISTYNFGSLSRYRIPCLPLFAMALGLIFYSKYAPEDRKFLPFGERDA